MGKETKVGWVVSLAELANEIEIAFRAGLGLHGLSLYRPGWWLNTQRSPIPALSLHGEYIVVGQTGPAVGVRAVIDSLTSLPYYGDYLSPDRKRVMASSEDLTRLIPRPNYDYFGLGLLSLLINQALNGEETPLDEEIIKYAIGFMPGDHREKDTELLEEIIASFLDGSRIMEAINDFIVNTVKIIDPDPKDAGRYLYYSEHLLAYTDILIHKVERTLPAGRSKLPVEEFTELLLQAARLLDKFPAQYKEVVESVHVDLANASDAIASIG